MTIQEMHQTFRVFAQQMGMQLVRAILPEEIDVYLNAAINEKVREVIISNVNINNTGKLIINSNISPINYIRTLYKKKSILVPNNTFKYDLDVENVMYYTSFSIDYGNDNVFKCRLVEHDEINNLLIDYCNAPSKEYPIITLYINLDNKFVAQVYNDNNKIYGLIINYIENPAKVSLGDNIDCNLPEYTHDEIVQLACQKYFVSVGATTQPVNK